MNVRRRGIGAVLLAALALTGAAASAGGPETLIAGFEWEEFNGKLGRWGYRGKPYPKRPPAGWKGEKTDREQALKGGFQIINGRPSSSRHMPGMLCEPKHATQGAFALHFLPQLVEMYSWKNLERVVRRKWMHNFRPGAPGYDPVDWYYQRFCHVWRRNWNRTTDWSAYDRLRFDVHAEGEPVILGLRVRDGIGPRINAGPTGVKTAIGLFTVPADRTVTCEFPLAEMARVGEVNLRKVHRVFIRLNGLPSKNAPKNLFLDNIRLVAKGADVKPALKLVPMQGEPRPHTRLVDQDPPTKRLADKRRRNTGPVDPLGPVTINQAALYWAAAGHLVGPGHFGGSGATYFRNARRGVVAYDNDRMVVVMVGRGKSKRGGLIALATFDGGVTWGGLTPEDKDFTRLPWGLRAGVSADYYGDVYYLGTPNCDSYREGQDVCMFRLAFTGETWVPDRFAVVYQNGYKCPSFGRGLRMPNGRIWLLWHDGFGGNFAKYSDDDGYTFVPCKDAAREPPRPFYTPELGTEDWPPKPPENVILFPALQRVAGFLLVPYGDQVACLAGDGTYQVHDGTKWGPKQPGPKWPGDRRKLGLVSETVLGRDQIVLARSARYASRGESEPVGALHVARRLDDGWKVETLEPDGVAESILTAGGNVAFCFYVRKTDDDMREVRCRRLKNGAWGPSELLATEPFRINHLAAPQTCPPSYACVLYDQFIDMKQRRTATSVVRLVRVPNR